MAAGCSNSSGGSEKDYTLAALAPDDGSAAAVEFESEGGEGGRFC